MKIELKFKEHYFTSSKYKGGFFTLDNSPDLRKEEIVELEKKGLYNPAINLPSSPSESDIEQFFPINLSFFRLKSSGRYVFLHSKYTGKTNHSVDRFGNFFSHSLILSEAEPLFPVKFAFDKVTFKESFNRDEDVSYSPRLNTDAQIVIENSDFTNEELFRHFQNFLISEPNRLKIIGKVFDLILEGKISKAGYNITICDKKENLANLIFAVNYFLPRILANRISFATYVDNPDSSNYPFEITGIIPECGIERLPEQYFNLVNAATISDYIPNQPYSQTLTEILTSGNFNSWKIFLAELDDFEIIELNQSLNKPALYLNFKNNIKSKTIEDFVNLLALKLPIKKEEQLKSYLFEKRPELYLETVIKVLKTEILGAVNFITKAEVFKKIYKLHFDNNDLFRTSHLFQFAESFRDELTGDEKNDASIFILTNANCLNVLPATWLEDKMREADCWFQNEDVDILEKLQVLEKLTVIYKLEKFDNLIPNIMKIKEVDEIIKAVDNGNFRKLLNKHKEQVLKLKDSEKVTVFTLAFNKENIKGQFDFKNYSWHIGIIKEYFENDDDFWFSFFKKNQHGEANTSIKKYSINYLMKQFIVYCFMKEDIHQKLLEKILPIDEYSIKWIKEEIEERASDSLIVEKFESYLRNKEQSKREGIFSFFQKKSLNSGTGQTGRIEELLNRLMGIKELNDEQKKSIKFHIESIINAKDKGIPLSNVPLHIIFQNSYGQSLTNVATIIAEIYFELGLVNSKKISQVSKFHLVGDYSQHTTSKIQEIFANAKDGILFIENANLLMSNSSDTNGREALMQILKEIQLYNHKIYFIFSGYSTEMEKIISGIGIGNDKFRIL